MRSRSLLSITLAAITVALVLSATTRTACASWFTTSEVIPGTGSHTSPAVEGTQLVYELIDGGVPNIWLHDIAAGTQRCLLSSANRQEHPGVSGTHAVWQEYRNGDWDVCVYNLQTGQANYTTTTSDEYNASISGNRAVFEVAYEYKGSSGVTQLGWDVYIWDTVTGERIRPDFPNVDGAQRSPAIHGNKVVYQDSRNGNWDIYCYDLATKIETRLTTDSANQTSPKIWGAKVVYADDRNGNSDIYLYDLAANTEKALTTDPADQTSPEISGDIVAWQDARSGVAEIWATDLPSGLTKIASGGSSDMPKAHPAVSGSRIAWHTWMSDQSASKIFTTQLCFPALSASTPLCVSYGARARVTGTLRTAAGDPVVGKPVTLQYSTNGTSWVSYATTTTVAGGGFGLYSPALTTGRYLRVRFEADADLLGATSISTLVRPAVSLTTPSTATTVYHNAAHSVRGYLRPRHTAGTYPVRIQCYRRERRSDGTYAYILRKTVYAKASNYSTYSYSVYSGSVSFPSAGSWRIRAYHPTDSTNSSTYSSWRSVTVK